MVIIPYAVGCAAGAIFYAIALFVLRWSRGGATLSLPRCPHCSVWLRGAGTSIPERCSECGKETSERGGPQIVAFPKHTFLRRAVAWIIMIPCAAAALGGTLVWAAMHQRNHSDALAERTDPTMTHVPLPTMEAEREALLRRLAYLSIEDLKKELHASLDAAEAARSKRSSVDRDPFARQTIASDATRSNGAQVIAALATELDRDEALDPTTFLARLRDALPPLSLRTTPIVMPTFRVAIRVELLDTLETYTSVAIDAVRINGVETPLSGNVPSEDLIGAFVRFPSSRGWGFDAPPDPGTYEVAIDWRSALPAADAQATERDTPVLRRHTTLHTLTVQRSAATLERVIDPVRVPIHEHAPLPQLVLTKVGERMSAMVILPRLSLRLIGDLSIVVGEEQGTRPIRFELSRSSYAAWSSVLLPTPADGVPNSVRVRYHPTTYPIESSLHPSGAVQPDIGALWALPTDLFFERTTEDSQHVRYRLTGVQVVSPSRFEHTR